VGRGLSTGVLTSSRSMHVCLRILPALLVLALLAAAPCLGYGVPEAASAGSARADTTEVVRVELLDGSVLIGTVVRETEAEIVLVTAAGIEITVPRTQIRRLARFEGRVDNGRLIIYDPNRTRLLFTPTARPLGAGQGYLAVYQLFFPFVAFGITDEVSLAGGTILLPGLFGRVLYLAPKVTLYNRAQLSVALGGVGVGIFAEGENTTAGIGYGLVTYGSPEASVSAGLGFAFAEGDLSSGGIVTLGGEYQVSNSIKLLSENYLIPFSESRFEPSTSTVQEATRYELILSFGVRFFGQRLAVDLAGITAPSLIGEDAFPFFPWVGFAYNFGR
jgi:hypothetical protein